MGAYGGLASQFGMHQETTVGTAVTVDTFYEILAGTDSMYDINLIEGAGIQAGVLSKRDSRVSASTYSASGTLVCEIADQGHMGLLLKNICGAVTGPTQISASTAYKQIHTPGSKDTLGLTTQFGMPRLSDGTVIALTYNGCKFTDATFSCNTGQFLQVSAVIDGWNEVTATALATASYTAGASIFPFKDAQTFTLGGTASTSAGLTTIASGVTGATLIKSIEWTISTPMANQRFGLGSSGIKANQVQNGFVTLTGKMDAEFTNRTELYDLYRSQTSTPMQIDWFHGDAGSSNPYRFQLIIPAMRVTKADIAGYGAPDIGSQKIEFEALLDANANPLFQIYYVSKDTTL